VGARSTWRCQCHFPVQTNASADVGKSENEFEDWILQTTIWMTACGMGWMQKLAIQKKAPTQLER
jgi:hypothetical protein